MRKRKTYNRVAQFYDYLDLPFEYFRYRAIRRAVFSGLNGNLLDAGVGTGRNIPYYPEEGIVTGIDLSPAMLERANWRRERLGTKVSLVEMNVTNLAFADNHFDRIVSTFLFCVLGDKQQLPALKELNRVCQPDGRIYLVDYIYSNNPFRRFVMKLWAPFVEFAYGAKFDRNTECYLEDAGLELVETRYLYRDIVRLLVLRRKTPE